VGVVQRDGSFRLTTFVEGDGAMAGEHTVTILPIPGGEEDAGKPTVSSQYCSLETSGLTNSVTSGMNTPKIQIDRPQKGQKGK
jgi:hypothetical protein